MAMPGRKYSQPNTKYRYGFNGKENDKDAGEGIQDYGMRIYDGRLGKFFSVDPFTKKYPELTPYQFATNSPISGIDLDGLEYYFYVFLDADKNGNSMLKLAASQDILGYIPQTFLGLIDWTYEYKASEHGIQANFVLYNGEWKLIPEKYLNQSLTTLTKKELNSFTSLEQIEAIVNLAKTIGTDASNAINVVMIADGIKNIYNGLKNIRNELKSLKRLKQDVALGVNKKAPPALSTQGRTIGKSKSQNTAVQNRVAELKKEGATDIRIDQQQVDVNGNHVGVNRPDLQYTLDGKRNYVEWDTPSSGRGAGHADRIKANDPSAGKVELIIMK